MKIIGSVSERLPKIPIFISRHFDFFSPKVEKKSWNPSPNEIIEEQYCWNKFVKSYSVIVLIVLIAKHFLSHSPPTIKNGFFYNAANLIFATKSSAIDVLHACFVKKLSHTSVGSQITFKYAIKIFFSMCEVTIFEKRVCCIFKPVVTWLRDWGVVFVIVIMVIGIFSYTWSMFCFVFYRLMGFILAWR